MSFCREWYLRNKRDTRTLINEGFINREPMKKNSGVIFQYTDKCGKTQKAKALYSEQAKVFQESKRVFLRLLDDDLTDKKDENGKLLISLQYEKELTLLGYID